MATTTESESVPTGPHPLEVIDPDGEKEGVVKAAMEGRKPIRIYVDGCWDVMHSGHYNAIRQARSLGDVLVVGVHADEEIARNKRVPVMKNEERLAAVRACKWADEICFGAPYSTSPEFLDSIRCDFVAHGDDIPIAADGKSCFDSVWSRLKIFKRTPGVSTTAMIERLLQAVGTTDGKKSEQAEGKGEIRSWSQFLATSYRISAFSNHRVPKADDVVVYIDGVFDLFHVGHIQALQEARKHGTFLYVGLYDDSIIQQQKGRDWPMMNLQERTLNVLSCRHVDEVVIGCPWKITKDMIQALNIAKVIVAPATLLTDQQMDRYDVPRQMGILEEVPPADKALTTEDVVQRIIDNHQEIQRQNAARVTKELNYMKDREYVREG